MASKDFGPANPFETENGLGTAERRIMDAAKKEHRETTQVVRRALTIAEQTAEMANNTLIEVHRQGQVLQKTDHGMAMMESDVAEASRLMKFMRRWCCFQVLCCCDCFDPDVKSDRTRSQRIKQRRQNQTMVDDMLQLEHVARYEEVKRIPTKGDPAFNGDQDAARSELFAAGMYRKATHDGLRLVDGLPEPDRTELEGETREQDQYLDRIGTTVESLKVMSLEMQEELESQAPQIDSLGNRTLNAQQSLKMLSRQTRRV